MDCMPQGFRMSHPHFSIIISIIIIIVIVIIQGKLHVIPFSQSNNNRRSAQSLKSHLGVKPYKLCMSVQCNRAVNGSSSLCLPDTIDVLVKHGLGYPPSSPAWGDTDAPKAYQVPTRIVFVHCPTRYSAPMGACPHDEPHYSRFRMRVPRTRKWGIVGSQGQIGCLMKDGGKGFWSTGLLGETYLEAGRGGGRRGRDTEGMSGVHDLSLSLGYKMNQCSRFAVHVSSKALAIIMSLT